MKILQVCPYDFDAGGGVKSHVMDLSIELRKHGHTVKIIAPGGDGLNTHGDVIRIGESYKFGVNRTTLNLTGLSFNDLRELKEFLNREQFDVIHYHEIWVPFLPMNILHLSKSANVVTFHGTPPDTIGSKIIEATLMPFYGTLTFDYFDKVITVSHAPIPYLRKVYDGEFEIIPNGIDLTVFNPENKPFEKYLDGKINILFLGRLDKRKGVLYLLKAFNQLKQKCSNVRLLIAGDGDQRDDVEEYIDENNLKDVEVLGYVDEKDKPRYFATCDIFCSPAIEGESFGIVLLEAMATKKPVVAYANPGYKEVLKGKGADLLVEPKDIGGLSKTLELLVRSEDLRNAYSEWGVKEVHQYQWNYIYDKIIKVYNEAITEKKDKPETTLAEYI